MDGSAFLLKCPRYVYLLPARSDQPGRGENTIEGNDRGGMQQGPLDVGRVSFGIHVWLRPQRLLRATELKSVHASFFFSAQARFDPASLCTTTRNPSPSKKQHPCFTRTAVSPAPTMKSGGARGGEAEPGQPATVRLRPARPSSHPAAQSEITFLLHLNFMSTPTFLFHYIDGKVKMWSKNVDTCQEGRIIIHYYLTQLKRGGRCVVLDG